VANVPRSDGQGLVKEWPDNQLRRNDLRQQLKKTSVGFALFEGSSWQPDEGRRAITSYTKPGHSFRCRGRLVARAVAPSKEQTGNNAMKKILLSIVLAVVAPLAWAQVSETTTTTTTTEGSGTITAFTPGSTIVLKESSGPRTYRFGKTVTYVTRSGKVLDENVVKTRVKVGIPVRVHYVGTGDNIMVDRVVLDED
jgi:hypothetical protein